ncbi:MAG: NADH-quinone oxidoreductase subunit L [Chloroflexota bacterium]
MLDYAWLILALPLAAFITIVAFTLKRPQLSGYLTIAGIFGAFAVSVGSFFAVAGGQHLDVSFVWFSLGDTQFRLGLMVDSLTAMMLIVVTGVSLLVQIYSQGYMHGDPGYSRYFAFMALFTTSMLGLVLAPNFLQLYIFWELVGLCSYLLIGFWFRKPEAAAAAKKAFITTRLGDLGLLVGILIIFWQTGTFSFDGVDEAVRSGILGGTMLTMATILVFAGAVGKSAQFPLHVWLPDAMEGPTPVSALIHAATMVAAGVYLVARSFEIFSHAPTSMLVVAYIGGITALMAATMGVVNTDIKRVLAYSTISQLGFMMLALGVGGYVAGVTHLANHAFFKSMLFLGSGSVIHAVGAQDMNEFSGLGRRMKITAATFLIGALSISGVPPLSGFWSKDEILADALHNGQILLFIIAVLAAVLTAFYMFRLFIRTFMGEYRAPEPAEGGHGGHGGHHGVHESPWVMTIPLIILAIPSLFSGLLGSPLFGNWYANFLGEGGHAAGMDPFVAGVSLAAAAVGIGLAWAMYSAKIISAPAIQARFAGVHTLLVNKYYMDDLYLWIIRRVVLGISNAFQVFDLAVIDGVVNGVGRSIAGAGSVLRAAQTGRVQNYGLAFFGGVVIVAIFTIFVR